MSCEYCQIVNGKSSNAEIIYEDEQVLVVVKDTAVTPGQITIFPKEHYTILEIVPDEIMNKCVQLANKIGIAVFESLGAQGTNIIVQNGTGAGQKVPHFAIEVVPRREGDGLNFEWKAQQLMDDEMDTVHLMLKEEGERLVIGQKKEKKVASINDEETKKIISEKGKDNYLLKSQKRIP